MALPLVAGCAEPALRKGAFEIELTGGWNEIEKPSTAADNADAGGVGTLAAGYAVNDWLEPGLLAQVSTASIDRTFNVNDDAPVISSVEADLTTVLVGPFLRFNLPTASPIIPFAEISAGFASADLDGHIVFQGQRFDDSQKEHGWFYQGGLGARWFVLEELAITGVARYQWIDVSDFEKIEQLQLSLGLSLVF